MLIKLEKRKEPSQTMLYATPVIAVLLTMIVGGLLFTIIGHNGFNAVWEIFIRWFSYHVQKDEVVVLIAYNGKRCDLKWL